MGRDSDAYEDANVDIAVEVEEEADLLVVVSAGSKEGAEDSVINVEADEEEVDCVPFLSFVRSRAGAERNVGTHVRCEEGENDEDAADKDEAVAEVVDVDGDPNDDAASGAKSTTPIADELVDTEAEIGTGGNAAAADDADADADADDVDAIDVCGIGKYDVKKGWFLTLFMAGRCSGSCFVHLATRSTNIAHALSWRTRPFKSRTMLMFMFMLVRLAEEEVDAKE